MASKSLILRTGASFFNRISKPFLQSQSQPLLFPPLSNALSPLNDVESPNNNHHLLHSQGFLYPSGLPSLRFFLPQGDASSPDDPMLLFPKRTFQPSTIRRKRNHGFFARKATKGGRKVIARRIAKGRSRVTA